MYHKSESGLLIDKKRVSDTWINLTDATDFLGGCGGGGGGAGGVFLGVAEQLTSGDNVGEEILFCFVWLFTW